MKTFREYKKQPTTFKDKVKEQVLLLLSLIKHGIQVFGSVKEFDQWLNRSNFYFDNKSPNDYLNTITGIKFVDDRLTATEYGDNVQGMEVFRISKDDYLMRSVQLKAPLTGELWPVMLPYNRLGPAGIPTRKVYF
ncbi:hypothetical protein GCM10028805_36900 [Spirosoma harenae]